MKVLFIRHGEAEHNVAIAEARRLGHSVPEAMGAAALLDARLTAAGRAQAEALRERLAPLGVELVATSPLRRCLQTTRLAFGDAVPIAVLDALRERHGLFPCERHRGRAQVLEALAGRRVAVCEVPGEDALWREDVYEPESEMLGRARQVLQWLMGRNERTVAVVSHGVFLHGALLAAGNGRLVLDAAAERTLPREWHNCEVRALDLQPAVLARPLCPRTLGPLAEPPREDVAGPDRKRRRRPKGQWLHLSGDGARADAGLFVVAPAQAPEEEQLAGGTAAGVAEEGAGAAAAGAPQAERAPGPTGADGAGQGGSAVRRYCIRSRQTRMFLNLCGGRAREGEFLQMWDNPRSAHSQWQLAPADTQPQAIMNVSSGMYIQIQAVDEGSFVHMTADKDDPGSHWLLEDAGVIDGEACTRLRSAKAGRYLVLAPL